MAKYFVSGLYRAEFEIETDLVGKELFEYYSGLLHSVEVKQKAMLAAGTWLYICECGTTYNRTHKKFCSNCGRELIEYDKIKPPEVNTS